MPTRELSEYRYRGARALVLLHEKAMREYLPVWKAAARANVRLPATDDPSYASMESLLFHAFRASRGYMTWLCEKLELPDPRIDEPPAAASVEREADRYLEHLLERWRAPLSGVEAKRFEATFVSRWGETMSCEGMLEHAVMHPVRHRFQLEELLERPGA
jgi:uncharacterized damage-inducible protein DinB